MRTYDISEFECICICVAKNECLNNLECYYAEQYDAYVWMGGYNARECGTARVSAEMNDDRRSRNKRQSVLRNVFKRM